MFFLPWWTFHEVQSLRAIYDQKITSNKSHPAITVDNQVSEYFNIRMSSTLLRMWTLLKCQDNVGTSTKKLTFALPPTSVLTEVSGKKNWKT